MRSFILTFLLFFVGVHTVLADTIVAKIHEITLGGGNGQEHLVKMENGRVVFLSSDQREVLEDLQKSLNARKELAIKVNPQNEFVALEIVEGLKEEEVTETSSGLELSLRGYDPTIVPDLNFVNAIFKKMRRDYQNDSQCYNRAHVWAYEEFKATGLNSMKLFLFFTNRYIRNYRYKWWFHVSPMVNVNINGTVVQKVIDRRYTGSPRSVKNWTDVFIYSRMTCPEAAKYSDYYNNQESQDCYVIPRSMYFWQPRDISYEDYSGYQKKQFYSSEVNHAYWEAF